MEFNDDGHEFLWRNMREGVALLDRDGVIKECNTALCHILGWADSQLKGKHFTEITTTEDRRADEEKFSLLIEGRIPSYEMSKRWKHKLGHIVPGDLYVTHWHDEVMIFGSLLPQDTIMRAASGEPDAQKVLDQALGSAIRHIAKSKTFWIVIVALLTGNATLHQLISTLLGGE